MKNYVINLARSSDRLEFMEKQFLNLSLRFERVEAVDANFINSEELCHYHQAKYRKKLSDSQIACFLSHRRSWQLIANGEEEWAAVFEDDVYISLDYPNFFKNFSFPKGIELLSFEKFGFFLASYPKELWSKDQYKIHQLLIFHCGAGGYFVSKKMAKILLECSEIFYRAVDHFLFDPREYLSDYYGAYQLFPALCAQRHTMTSKDLENFYKALSNKVKFQYSCQNQNFHFSSKAPHLKSPFFHYLKHLKRHYKWEIKKLLNKSIKYKIDLKD